MSNIPSDAWQLAGAISDASGNARERIAHTLVPSSSPPSEGASLKLELGRRSHEVPLAELDATLTQDVVGGRGMKIEVRQAEVQQQRLPGELALAARKFHRDLLVLAAIDLRRLDRLDEFDCLGNAFLELGKRCFRVGESRQLDTGEASAGADRMIGRRPHLSRQRAKIGTDALYMEIVMERSLRVVCGRPIGYIGPATSAIERR